MDADLAVLVEELSQRPVRDCLLIPTAPAGLNLGQYMWAPGHLSFQLVISGAIPTTPWNREQEYVLRSGGLLCCAAGGVSVRRYVARKHLAWSIVADRVHVHRYQRSATDAPGISNEQRWQFPLSSHLQQLSQLIEMAMREQLDETYIEQLLMSMPFVLRHCIEQSHQTHIADIKTWLQEHVCDDVSRDDLARHLECHPDHVTRIFREQLKTSFALERKRLRCQLACTLLVEGQLSLASIAERCGFSSEQYFIRCFKELFASTPRQWQKRQQHTMN